MTTPSTNKTYWDIETGALPLTLIAAFMPTEWKLGNVKDPTKVAAAKAEKEKEWLEDAALSALTGEVLAIGVKDDDGFRIISGEEHDILTAFWSLWKEHNRMFVGFNTHRFDFQFLLRRSWRWEIDPGFRAPNKPWDLQNSVDLVEKWTLGDKQEYISMKNVALFMDLPPKLGEGADFATLWQTDRGAAETYLQRDVELVELMANRMGV